MCEQTATNEVEERYREAKNWVEFHGRTLSDHYSRLPLMSKKAVKEELNKRIEKKQDFSAEKSKDALGDIEKSEKYLEEFVKNALKPIRKWIMIFLVSLVSLIDTVEFIKHCLSGKN